MDNFETDVDQPRGLFAEQVQNDKANNREGCSLFTENPTHFLVATIRTVEFSIATPFCRHTVLLGTLELFDWIALGRRAFRFVRAIAAVVVTVAYPPTLYTASVVAGELVRAASVICETNSS